MSIINNEKYEITDIAHETYPFLHRIRALQDIGDTVKAGDLGGFVESESNLSCAPDDQAWLLDDAIAAGEALVAQGAVLAGTAVACGNAYISEGSVLRGQARAEDYAYIQGAVLTDRARASGNSMVLQMPGTDCRPVLSESCSVYGTVQGDVQVKGSAVIASRETIINDTLDTLVIRETGRSIQRDPARDELRPCQKQKPAKSVKKKRGMER